MKNLDKKLEEDLKERTTIRFPEALGFDEFQKGIVDCLVNKNFRVRYYRGSFISAEMEKDRIVRDAELPEIPKLEVIRKNPITTVKFNVSTKYNTYLGIAFNAPSGYTVTDFRKRPEWRNQIDVIDEIREEIERYFSSRQI